MRNKKGFTLIEILLIIVLIGMLATAAFSAFFDTSKSFTFISEYKPIISTLRKARSYAINNRESALYDRYGVMIDTQRVILFGDLGTPYEYLDEVDEIIVELDFTDSDYRFDPDDGFPAYLFYENGTGELTSYGTFGPDLFLLEKSFFKRLDFRFTDDEDLEKYFYIFQVSGIVEESATPL